MDTLFASELASAYIGDRVTVYTEMLDRARGEAWKTEDGNVCISVDTRHGADVLTTLLHEIRHHLRGDVVLPRSRTRYNAGADLTGWARSEFDRIIGDMEDDCWVWAEAEARRLRDAHPDIDARLMG